jgi:hypothetical protein
MEERDNKTIICSVLFLDIVEYSQKAVSGQISLKEGFNVFLSAALDGIPVEDRIILDTGDGAAISFLGDIEDALKVGLSMRKSLLAAGIHMDTPLLVRMGINLGPVRLVKDINNQPNIVGDGINVAQRVMDFADVGQLLVSRSYYDAVSRISQEYAGMFHYQGSRTDKHVREHEVYAIGYPGEFTLAKMSFGVRGKLKKVSKNISYTMSRLSGGIYGALLELPIRQKLLVFAVVAVVVAVFAGGLSAWKRSHAIPAKQVVVRYYPDADPAASAVSVTSQKQSTESTAPVKVAKKPESASTPKKTSIARVRTLEETIGKVAVMKLMVLPWGEVYLDGRMQGVSPPLMELQVAPGKHEIEIRNTNFPAYKQVIQVKVGEQLKIQHTFAN